MAVDKLLVFWDADALIAGANSPAGGAGFLLLATEQRLIAGCTSPLVLMECRRNLATNLPLALPAFERILRGAQIKVIAQPSRRALRLYELFADQKDVPNVAAAHRAKATHLLTFNLKHYVQAAIKTKLGIKIVTPGEFLEELRPKDRRS